MRTSNPMFRHDAYQANPYANDSFASRYAGPAAAGAGSAAVEKPREAVMTVGGTIIKTAILLLACVICAIGTYDMMARGALPPIAALGASLGACVLALIVGFKPASAPYLALPTAALEGVLVGGISLFIAERLGPKADGIIFQAALITFGILAAMLGLFAFRVIRIGPTATKVILAATLGVALIYLASVLLRVLGMGSIPFIHEGGPIGIGFSLVVIVLASLNLVLDFQYVEAGVANRAPKYMEWAAGVGLLVTVVWLYIEVLRLLAKLRSNN
jgi:uncharacterized YccA/Bax inhibitor family protein